MTRTPHDAPMTRPRRRLILVHPAGREDFLAFVRGTQWKYQREVQEDRARHVPYELLYTDPERQTWLHYVDDYIAEMRYVVVAGRDVEEGSAEVARGLPVYDPDALIAWALSATDPREVALAVRHVAVAAPAAFDPAFFSALEHGLTHPDPATRVMAIRACAYPAWPELRPVLTTMRDTDSNPRVRDAAAGLLSALEQPSA